MDFGNARRSLNDLYSRQYNEKRNWFRFALAEAVIIVVLILALVGVAMIAKPYPWIVQVDEHGFEVAIGTAGKQEVDQRVVISRIGRFIEASRTVISDAPGQEALLKWSYAAVPQDSKALTQLEKSLKEADPFKLAKQDKSVSVVVNNILPKGGNAYQASWTEKYYSSGSLEREIDFTGHFVIMINPSKNGKDVINNPLGVYITDYQFGPNYIQK